MNRFHYIDLAKGTLILCLLVSHFGIALEKNNVGTQFFAPILYWTPLFSTFFMQCFFLITGYCSNFDLSAARYFEKLFKRLLVPYVFLGLLNGLASHILMPHYFDGFFTCFWFLNALVISKTIVWGLGKIMHKDKNILCVSFMLMISGIVINEYCPAMDFFDFSKGLIACFFVSLGHFLRNHSLCKMYFEKCWLVYPVVMLGCYLFHCQWNLPSQDANINTSISQIPLFLILTISGSATFLVLSKKIDKFPLLEFFGRNSIIVYCLHFPYLYWFTKLMLIRIVPSSYLSGGIIFVLVFVSEIVLLILFIKFLNIYPLSVLIGKYKR